MSAVVRFPDIDLTPYGSYDSSTVTWIETTPGSSTVMLEVSTNGDDFSAVSNGGSIPGLSASQSLVGVSLVFRLTLTASGTDNPTLGGLSISVLGEGAALVQATNRYNNGQLKWLTGANAGVAMEIKKWDATSREVTMFLPMDDDIQAGDTFEIYPGCNKGITDCGGFYDNILNFRGFPTVPGQDNLLRYPDAV